MGITLATTESTNYTIARQSNARELGYKIAGTDISEYVDVSYKEYTTPGTYTITVPNIASYISVVLIGGGGGGGNGGRSDNDDDGTGAGGGGGGAIFVSDAVRVSPSTAITIVIGAGGAGSTSNSNNGVAGGETSITVGSTKIFGAGGGGGGVRGALNRVQDQFSGVGNGGTGGTKYIDPNYTSYEYQSSTGGSGENGATVSNALWAAGKGGDISITFSGTPAYYSNISYTGAARGTNYNSTGYSVATGVYGAGGAGGNGGQENYGQSGGNGGKGGNGYARIYFYI